MNMSKQTIIKSTERDLARQRKLWVYHICWNCLNISCYPKWFSYIILRHAMKDLRNMEFLVTEVLKVKPQQMIQRMDINIELNIAYQMVEQYGKMKFSQKYLIWHCSKFGDHDKVLCYKKGGWRPEQDKVSWHIVNKECNE